MFDSVQYGRGTVVSDEGVPAPCLRLERGARFRIRLAVKQGARNISAKTKQPNAAAARPVLRVLQNLAIGLPGHVEAGAGAGVDWQDVTLAFTAATDGGVVVELENPDTQNACWWDEIRVT